MAQSTITESSVIKESKSDKIFLGIVYMLLIIAFLIVSYPLIYIISASLSEPSAVNSGAMCFYLKE